jgi:RNA polymerase sigma-70 factor (ECF subfamily)
MIDWALIVAEHGATVWRTVYRLLDHHADALDCYQETFLAAWQYAERRQVADFASFLISLATRRALDRLRQRYRARNRVIAIDRLPEPSSEADCPLRRAYAKELMDRVRVGMAELPDKQARVFWLSCIEGFFHQQISDDLGISLGEVRVLLHRARKHLGAVLDSSTWSRGEDDERESAAQP